MNEENKNPERNLIMSNAETSAQTVTMSIVRALKEKSRIARRLIEARSDFVYANGRDPELLQGPSAETLYAEIQDLQRRYLLFKQSIARANAGITDQLTEMLVVRAEIEFYSNIYNATRKGCDGSRDSEEHGYLTADECRSIRTRLQARLDKLQDEVDAFNATHHLEVPA